MKKIFVIIYAYRDLELSKTIDDLFKNANSPEDVVVGCINADDEEYHYKGKYEVRVKNTGFKKRHGCGLGVWEITQELYQDEEWILRAAPHSRFKKGWDSYYRKYAGKNIVLCQRCLEYMPDGTLGDDKKLYSKPTELSDKLVYKLEKVEYNYTKPFEVLFMQAGGMFCHKSWLDKVGYDPNIAMWGEETDLSARSYMSGFRMYHIPEAQVYHLWHRRNRKGLDHSIRFNEANQRGIDMVKGKLGISAFEVNDYYVDCTKYKDIVLLDHDMVEKKTKIDIKLKKPKHLAIKLTKKADEVVECECGSKVFYNKGICRFCGRIL